MSSDEEDRTPAQAARQADHSGEMEDKLEQLDDDIADATKKAGGGRPQGDPPAGDDPVDDVAGGGSDHDEHVDDPEGPLVAE